MWKEFYKSYWQNPGILVFLPVLVLFLLPRRASWIRNYLLFFSVETIVDALATGPLLREFQLSDTGIAQGLSIFFVILGDFRILLLGLYLLGRRGLIKLYGAALGLSLIVPLLQALAIESFPSFFAQSNAVYLVYELLCIALLLILSMRTGLYWLYGYAAAYYTLWALADVMILSGLDAGYALRALPNLLYYGLTTTFIALWFSRSSRYRSFWLALSLCVLAGCQSRDCPPDPAASAVGTEGPSATILEAAAVSVVPVLPDQYEGTLILSQDGEIRGRPQVAQLIRKLGAVNVSSLDPHYEKVKEYRTFSLSALLHSAFGLLKGTEVKGDFTFIASDGYRVTFSAEQAFHPKAYLAFADMRFPQWEPVGEKKSNPGPFYIVWQGSKFQSLQDYPRPWAVIQIDYQPSGSELPDLLPPSGLKSASAKHGHELFLAECVHCHAINRQGGQVGPELNVPMNILSYRTEKQVRDFIRNASQFRPGVMPPHPDFKERDYRGILAYFRAMADYQVQEVSN